MTSSPSSIFEVVEVLVPFVECVLSLLTLSRFIGVMLTEWAWVIPNFLLDCGLFKLISVCLESIVLEVDDRVDFFGCSNTLLISTGFTGFAILEFGFWLFNFETGLSRLVFNVDGSVDDPNGNRSLFEICLDFDDWLTGIWKFKKLKH